MLASQIEIGRIMMVYSLIINISPLASGLADRLGKNLLMVIGATVMSGIVLLGLYQSARMWRRFWLWWPLWVLFTPALKHR